MAVNYTVKNGELSVFDRNRVRYRGRPDGYPMEKVFAIPNSHDAIALLMYWAEGAPDQFANLVRLDPDGQVQWRAMPPEEDPESEDGWVLAWWADRGGLTANSWSCYRCKIDPDTGLILSATFTK